MEILDLTEFTIVFYGDFGLSQGYHCVQWRFCHKSSLPLCSMEIFDSTEFTIVFYGNFGLIRDSVEFLVKIKSPIGQIELSPETPMDPVKTQSPLREIGFSPETRLNLDLGQNLHRTQW